MHPGFKGTPVRRSVVHHQHRLSKELAMFEALVLALLILSATDLNF